MRDQLVDVDPHRVVDHAVRFEGEQRVDVVGGGDPERSDAHQVAGVAADLVLRPGVTAHQFEHGVVGDRLQRALADVSGVPLNDSIVVWHSLSIGNGDRGLSRRIRKPRSRPGTRPAAAGPAARAPNGGPGPGSRAVLGRVSAPMITDVAAQSWSQAADSVIGRCCASIRGSVARPSASSAPAPLTVPDRSRTAMPVAGSGPMIAARTTATAAGRLDAPVDGVLGRIEDCRGNRAPVDRCDAPGDRRRAPRAGVGTRRPARSRRGARLPGSRSHARIIKSRKQFRPRGVVHADLVGQPGSRRAPGSRSAHRRCGYG